MEKNIILVCDECFLDFAENAENLSIKNYLNKNTIILKGFYKNICNGRIKAWIRTFRRQ